MGDPRLWQKSLPVTRFNTNELSELLQDMRDTMAHLNGAGLAAPQIGVLLRVVIFGVQANPRYPAWKKCPTRAHQSELKPLSDEVEEGLGRLPVGAGHARLVPRWKRPALHRLRREGQSVQARGRSFHSARRAARVRSPRRRPLPDARARP
jgi:peptide deformylase